MRFISGVRKPSTFSAQGNIHPVSSIHLSSSFRCLAAPESCGPRFRVVGLVGGFRV